MVVLRGETRYGQSRDGAEEAAVSSNLLDRLPFNLPIFSALGQAIAGHPLLLVAAGP
jgi:hypothetical protein